MTGCPSCGAPHPERAQFCSECGAALSVASPEQRDVRKIVTVLFSDVTGSTALGERHDPEAIRRVMARYFDAARTTIDRHGGTVEKFIGDAVMAVFGIPAVHEDDALRAVRAAAELRDALRRLDAELEPTGIVLGVRIGVETGEVVAGIGSQGTTLATGDAVNVAARLEGAAKPGEILIGAETLALVRDAVVVDALPPLELKGKAEPVAAFRLVSVHGSGAGRARRGDTPMVGRGRELAVLGQAFERATIDRTAQLFTVFGPAGVGKSRLVREFLASVEPRATIRRGRCLPYGEGITYWPVITIVQDTAGIEESDSADLALTKIDHLIGESPEARLIAMRLAQILGLQPGVSPQEEIFWACRKFLEAAARDRPLVVLVEDVHWAEPTLLDLIEHVADLARDVPILLIATARPEMLETRPTWGGGRMNATAILLEPLSVGAALELIGGLLPGAGLPPAVLNRIAEAAEGNPLYAEELVGMFLDDGIIQSDGEGGWKIAGDLGRILIPRTIQALLAARLDRLPPAERSAAERASVIGRSFERGAVAHLTPEDARPDIPASLTALVRKDLIRPEPGRLADDAFRFRHILIRDAAYESLAKSDRAHLHERFADWLEDAAGDRLGEVEEIIGYHLEQAVRYRSELGSAGSPEVALARRAAGRLESAARRAVARSDARAAIHLLERTIALLPADDPARDPLLIDLGTALGDAGDFAGAGAVLSDVARRAEATGDARIRAFAVVQQWHNSASYPGHEAEARAEAQAAIALFEAAGDSQGLARSLMLMANIDWWSGHGAAAEKAMLTAMGYARRAGLARELSDGFGNLGAYFNTGPTPVTEAIRQCEAFLAAEAGNRAVEGWMWHALAHLRARLGEFDEARELAARARAILDEHGQLYEHATLSEMVADVEVLAGDPGAAVRVLEAGLAATTRTGAPSEMLAAFLARAACLAGDPERAGTAAKLGMTGDAWVRAIAESSLARVRAAEGAHEGAEKLSREAVASLAGTDFLNFHGWIMVNHAEVMEAAGRRDEAIRALETAIDLHGRKGSVIEVLAARARLSELA
ncbi:MAG: adenylate/guanylate cyclase domain-containing protein [Chloroflexota bacterium]